MKASPLIAAEKIQAQSIGVVGTLIIAGRRCPARIFTEKGVKYEGEGGPIQTRKLSAIVLCSLLPATAILTADGDTRSVEITHVETKLTYRIDTGGVDQSPHRVYWTLECSQPTAI